MEFGIALPQVGATWDEMLGRAQAAEAAGFDTVWLIDHLYGLPAERGILEVWTALSALAAATDRVHVGVHVLCQGFRNPALLAKMATTLDHIAPGRVRPLLGAGWHPEEHEAFGFEFPPHRVRLEQLEDTVKICKGMWTSGTDAFTFDGRHYSTNGVVNIPPPVRGIPVGIGGAGDRLLDLVAREADEWNCPGDQLHRLPDRVRLLDERLSEHGRTVRRTQQLLLHPGEATGFAPQIEEYFNPNLGLIGSTERMVDRLGELASLGMDGVVCSVLDDEHFNRAVEILPALRAATAG
jgi:alkanesulfonate monooxygenase SsuD/methylene tetrahydromethanopterin reductase-like flavin-dependent oxidoreductase (luciferase family)